MAKSKKFIKIAALAVLVAYAAYTLTRSLPAPTPRLSLKLPPASSANLSWPSSQAALGAEGFGLLATHEAQKPVPIASTAKLVTVLAVLHKYPLHTGDQGPTITLTARDVAYYQDYQKVGGSVVQVESGEQITELQAIQAMLLPSANNIAESLAVWAYGSMPDYLDFANKYVAQLGLTHTHMADSSGFSPKTTSTASDLVKLGLISLQNPTIEDVVAEKSTELPVVGTVYNVNWLLDSGGIDGIKTGNSDQAGGCYLFSATHDVSGHSVRLVGAIVGAADLKTAINAGSTLNSSAMTNFGFTQLAKTDQIVGQYSTTWGQAADIKTTQPLAAITWKPSPGNLELINNKLVWQSSAQEKYTVEVSPPSSVPGPSLIWRLTHPFTH